MEVWRGAEGGGWKCEQNKRQGQDTGEKCDETKEEVNKTVDETNYEINKL